MRSVILPALLLGLACGRVAEPNGNPPGDGATDANESATNDSAIRDDGCALRPADLKTPCAVGKVCEYPESCAGGWDHSLNAYECLEGPDKPLGWYYSPRSCNGATRPDGCPWAPPGPLKTECSTPGKTCEYPNCDAGAFERGVLLVECKSDGAKLNPTNIWRESGTKPCP